VTIC